MVQTERYQQIILDLLKDYASVKSPFWPNVENQVIANSQNQHYQLVRIGWDEHNKNTTMHKIKQPVSGDCRLRCVHFVRAVICLFPLHILSNNKQPSHPARFPG